MGRGLTGFGALLALLFALSQGESAFAGTAARPSSAGASELTVGETASLVGGAEGYEGGELFEGPLAAARKRVGDTVDLVEAGVASGALCTLEACQRARDASLCAPLRSLAQTERDACARFILTHAEGLRRAALPEVTPFRVSAVPLTVARARGGERPVTAVTRPGDGSPVVFHLGALKEAGEFSLLALLVHELGHKVSPASEKITETMLDAVGAALASLAATHLFPSQAAAPLPPTVEAKAWCGAVSSGEKAFVGGLVADLQGRVPEPAALSELSAKWDRAPAGLQDTQRAHVASAIAASPESRAAVVRDYFHDFLRRDPTEPELALALKRLGDGVSHLDLAASIAGHREYLASRGLAGDEAFVSSAFVDLHGRTPTAAELAEGVRLVRKYDRPTFVSASLKRAPAVATERWIGKLYGKLLNRPPSEGELREDLALFSGPGGWEAVASRLSSGTEYQLLQIKRWKNCSRR